MNPEFSGVRPRPRPAQVLSLERVLAQKEHDLDQLQSEQQRIIAEYNGLRVLQKQIYALVAEVKSLKQAISLLDEQK